MAVNPTFAASASDYRSKLIIKHAGKGTDASKLEPSPIDISIAKALFELQTAAQSELSAELQVLQIYGAREVDLGSGRKAIAVIVPIPQLKSWRRIQSRVTRELEKKFSDQAVVLIGMRRILPKPKRGQRVKQMRPRSRTLTAVHDAWLEDMVYPTEIVGKRTRVKTDGSKLLKVLLDPRDQSLVEGKLEAFAGVYRKLTGKAVSFEFPPLDSAN
jgi:small subunit ribosomal protein S7e